MNIIAVTVESINSDGTVNIRVEGLLIPKVTTISVPRLGNANAIVVGSNEYLVI